jgi:hypothetical protein
MFCPPRLGYAADDTAKRAVNKSSIQWTHHATPALIQNMCVNHRGGNIRMSEQLLHSADVVAALQ